MSPREGMDVRNEEQMKASQKAAAKNRVRVALDAMGGDLAPGEIVRGALDALKANPELEVVLVGLEEAIRPVLEDEAVTGVRVRSADEDGAGSPGMPAADQESPDSLLPRLSIEPASEIIEMAEPPVHAVTHKKDSSIVKGLQLVRHGECDAFVSAGSTGGILAGGQLIVGRIAGIRRPPLAAVMPTSKGPALLLDSGANVDARPIQLLQYAQMGSIYMEKMLGIRNPRVALYNVGTEEEKGNALVKEAYPLLRSCETINFTGNIEARDVPDGGADVIVCDAFVGNAILKMYEGVATVLLKEIKSTLMKSTAGKIGGLLIKPSLKELLKTFDSKAYGGAPMLGLKGLVVKVHGNASRREISTALAQCISFHEQKITELFKENIEPEKK